MPRRPNIYDQLKAICEVERKHNGFLLTYTDGTSHKFSNSTEARAHALGYALETMRMEFDKHGKTQRYYSLDKLVNELEDMLDVDPATIQRDIKKVESDMTDDDDEARWQKNHDIIEAALPPGQKRFVFYSVDTPLDAIAVKGRMMMLQMKDAFWASSNDAKNYQSDVMTDPTWLDIAIAANEMIAITTDSHHYFLEDIQRISETKDGVTVYGFIMGS